MSVIRRESYLNHASEPSASFNAFYGILSETDTHFIAAWYFNHHVSIEIPKDQCELQYGPEYTWYRWNDVNLPG